LLFERNTYICSSKKHFLIIIVEGRGALMYFELIDIITF